MLPHATVTSGCPQSDMTSQLTAGHSEVIGRLRGQDHSRGAAAWNSVERSALGRCDQGCWGPTASAKHRGRVEQRRRRCAQCTNTNVERGGVWLRGSSRIGPAEPCSEADTRYRWPEGAPTAAEEQRRVRCDACPAWVCRARDQLEGTGKRSAGYPGRDMAACIRRAE